MPNLFCRYGDDLKSEQAGMERCGRATMQLAEGYTTFGGSVAVVGK
jgi:hypothetical protein